MPAAGLLSTSKLRHNVVPTSPRGTTLGTTGQVSQCSRISVYVIKINDNVNMESAPTPLWWRHFRPITQDDHGTANTAFHECKRWRHKYLSIQWSKLLQNKRNSNDKITSLFAISNRAPLISESDMREPRSGNNRLLPNAKNRSHTNIPESDRTGPNPLTNQKWFTLTNQNRLFGTNQITAFVH